jgi:uncharacterized membrane protein (UPF0127 family)
MFSELTKAEKAKHYSSLIWKTVLSVVVYFLFFIYTPIIYQSAKSVVENSFLHSRALIVGEIALTVKVADSPEERQKGLSNTKSLGPKRGLFFIFEEEDRHGIWMKDMNYPIDIIWFDRYGSIVYLEENVSPDTYPRVFKPDRPSLYILEVNAGLIEKTGLRRGDTIDLY